MYYAIMAHFHIKTKKGRPYLYVREIARIDGKPKVISQIYIGSPERVAGLTQEKRDTDVATLKVEAFGAIWLAHQIDGEVDLCGLIDGIVPPADRETGPSIGEYFLYCVLNRMVQAVSKNKLAAWYRSTAIQYIRPVDLDELSSKRYWEKWDRVSEEDLRRVAGAFFERIWQLESPSADCLLFDTTNYYTYMAGHTESELALRGKNKAGKHHLRQIGLGLLVARDLRLPLYYSVYPGNIHDSKHFETVMDEMFGVVCGLNKTKERYLSLCERMHLPSELHELIFEHSGDALSMSFRKNAYLVERRQSMFGKNIIITDNMDWTTGDVVQASLDRWQVEDRFRLSKNDDLVGVSPVRHWTDSKIRCHLFTCVVAMTYLCRIELRLAAVGIKRTAADVMEDMGNLHQALTLRKGARKPERRIETPSKTQAEVLSAFGHYVDAGGVLRPIKP